jgi:ABC-type antimicrobial peptide transport system permease subunit
LLVRAQGDPRSIIPPVRAAVAWLDPEQPIHTITTLSERTAHRVGGLQMVGTMTIVFALTALVLTGVGVYGVMAFAVQRRTREFGIRLALGATGREILGLLFQQNALGTSVGVAAGLGLGFALTRPLAPYLLRVSANDPIIYAGVAIVLVAITVVAIWIPSRRAARVDPNVALRCE